MENKVKNIMSAVLSIDIELINNNTSPESVEEWDSLKQMNLIVALEEEFEIEFEDEDIIEMMDYKSILKILKNL
jgi:acyl carrier protein